jgi:DNA adenine methylase
MNGASPLRYPGGKSALVSLLIGIRRLNRLGSHSIAEPFAGGAGASLSLLYLEETPTIAINDADPAVHAFWWALTTKPGAFLQLVLETRVTLAEWKRQRAMYRTTRPISRLRRGFAAFYLNRCNRSGIIVNGGPIGGIKQTGKWKLGARYNRMGLARRCAKVADYRARIQVSCEDGLGTITRMDSAKTFFVIDPPYFHKGPALYLNTLTADYHEALAAALRSLSPASWILTYDDCPEIRRLYRGWAAIRPFQLRYTAANRGIGHELLITPKCLRLPERQDSAALVW